MFEIYFVFVVICWLHYVASCEWSFM